MARLRIKIGQSEVEIDSRDFYLDNESAGQVITDVSRHLTENSASLIYDTVENKKSHPGLEYMRSIEDAEVHEPEFSSPVHITGIAVKSKLEVLEKAAFFNKPRSTSEIVAQLREYGWIVSSLDVSKMLATMVSHRELVKDFQNNLNYYSLKENFLIN